jgi:hypothetical protein
MSGHWVQIHRPPEGYDGPCFRTKELMALSRLLQNPPHLRWQLFAVDPASGGPGELQGSWDQLLAKDATNQQRIEAARRHLVELYRPRAFAPGA